MKVIALVKADGLDAQISVKPTQLGFDQDKEVCFQHLAALTDAAVAAGNFMWLDMESSPYVDGTIALYKRLRERTPKVGIAIQAYLHRTAADIEPLVAISAAIRLVKGAYLEPPAVAIAANPTSTPITSRSPRDCSRTTRTSRARCCTSRRTTLASSSACSR
jgi:proline dehydrogenase